MFQHATGPLIDHYSKSGTLTVVNGEEPVEQVFAAIVAIVDGARGRAPKAGRLVNC